MTADLNRFIAVPGPDYPIPCKPEDLIQVKKAHFIIFDNQDRTFFKIRDGHKPN